jgi:hypothetical protein
VRSFHDPLKSKYDSVGIKLTSRPDGLFSKINASRVLTGATGKLSENDEKTVKDAIDALDEASRIINDFLDTDWVNYKRNLSGRSVPVNAIIK